MRQIRLFPLLAIIGLFTLAGCQTATNSMDHEKMQHGDMQHGQKVMVHQVWARASAGMAKSGIAFMSIMNHGMNDDRLLAARTTVSERAELHTHIMDGGVMRMRQVPHIDLPKSQTVMLKPGGLHVMLMNLHAPLKEGSQFPLTLEFEKAGSIKVHVSVKGAAAGAMGGKHMMH
jgi:periplasmic copper chaperone A